MKTANASLIVSHCYDFTRDLQNIAFVKSENLGRFCILEESSISRFSKKVFEMGDNKQTGKKVFCAVFYIENEKHEFISENGDLIELLYNMK